MHENQQQHIGVLLSVLNRVAITFIEVSPAPKCFTRRYSIKTEKKKTIKNARRGSSPFRTPKVVAKEISPD